MRFLLCLFVILALLAVDVPRASAKRVPPPDVQPVKHGAMEYHTPTERQGYVEAHEVGTNRVIWSRQIYLVIRDPDLEGDVQDVFINSLKLDGETLLISNERGGEFRLDLKSLQVDVIKGRIAIQKGEH